MLSDWYQRKHFGHDVSDPFEFPYLRFAEPPRAPGVPQYGRRTYALGVLEALAMIMEGMTGRKVGDIKVSESSRDESIFIAC